MFPDLPLLENLLGVRETILNMPSNTNRFGEANEDHRFVNSS